MSLLRVGGAVCAGLLVSTFVIAAEFSAEVAESRPEKLPAEIGRTLAEKGIRISGPDGELCNLWTVADLPTKEGFSPTLSIKYPFTQGQFIGVLQVQGAKFTDFRDQRLAPGLYMLRYGQQPQDGNHIGTSDYSDFLLALRMDDDKSPALISNLDDLQAISADAAGTAHPAIFQLLPPEEVATKPSESAAKLSHDADHDHWILQLVAGKKPLPLRLVIVGVAAE